jgi:ABC-type proline/glycine betaine transport system ATPase subunit
VAQRELTVVFVTHSIHEAGVLSTRVAVMGRGRARDRRGRRSTSRIRARGFRLSTRLPATRSGSRRWSRRRASAPARRDRDEAESVQRPSRALRSPRRRWSRCVLALWQALVTIYQSAAYLVPSPLRRARTLVDRRAPAVRRRSA